MEKYRASLRGISKHEIIKETDKNVFFKTNSGREAREMKISDWQSWHNSFFEAKEFLIKKELNEINKLKYQIEYHENNICEINKLKDL